MKIIQRAIDLAQYKLDQAKKLHELAEYNANTKALLGKGFDRTKCNALTVVHTNGNVKLTAYSMTNAQAIDTLVTSLISLLNKTANNSIEHRNAVNRVINTIQESAPIEEVNSNGN